MASCPLQEFCAGGPFMDHLPSTLSPRSQGALSPFCGPFCPIGTNIITLEKSLDCYRVSHTISGTHTLKRSVVAICSMQMYCSWGAFFVLDPPPKQKGGLNHFFFFLNPSELSFFNLKKMQKKTKNLSTLFPVVNLNSNRSVGHVDVVVIVVVVVVLLSPKYAFVYLNLGTQEMWP